MDAQIPGQPSAGNGGLDAAIAHVLGNRDDEVEGMFCHALFESGVFDPALFERLVADMERVSADPRAASAHRATLHWIVLGAC